MTLNSQIEMIADMYGYGAQSEILIEEMAELTQAILHRKRGRTQALDEIIEEIADVEIMLKQIKYLLDIPDIEIHNVKAYKVERQLIRIGRAEDAKSEAEEKEISNEQI